MDWGLDCGLVWIGVRVQFQGSGTRSSDILVFSLSGVPHSTPDLILKNITS